MAGSLTARKDEPCSRWGYFTLDAVADFIDDDAVRWWLHGWIDRDVPPDMRGGPVGAQAIVCNLIAYRSGLGLEPEDA